MNETPPPRPPLVDVRGKPIATDTRCPQCKADAKKRVPSANFGTNRHDVCSQCGFEFEELTV